MHVEYWAIGAGAMAPLPMSAADISTQLLADWFPSLPSGVSTALMGWPPFVVEEIDHEGRRHLSLRAKIGQTDRQWKGMLSWMLGVAGTRHVLQHEGYQWIAPVSAFYPEAAHEADLSAWHPSFPRSRLSAEIPAASAVRLRPDYLAMRPVQPNAPVDWAVAESKGTSRSVTSLAICPANWRNQVRNIEIKVDGAVINISRHIVVATRVNPNAKRSATRNLQVRAWNSTDASAKPLLPNDAAAEVAAAELFCLFRNLQLHNNAKSIAQAVEVRSRFGGEAIDDASLGKLRQLREDANMELSRLLHPPRSSTSQDGPTLVTRDSQFGPIEIEINSETMALATSLSAATTPQQAAQEFSERSPKIGKWEASQIGRPTHELPIGVRVRFPPAYYDSVS